MTQKLISGLKRDCDFIPGPIYRPWEGRLLSGSASKDFGDSRFDIAVVVGSGPENSD